MMTGRLTIDGHDVFTEFGIYVIEGGWDELLALPPLKPVASNDWQEEDGIEADLDAPVLNSREATIKFAISGGLGRYHDFIGLLSDNSVHAFGCIEIGRTFRLRLVSRANTETYGRLGFLSLKFADDYPLEDYAYEPPSGGGVAPCPDYLIDGREFTAYGIRILKGSLGEAIKIGDVKTGMLRNIRSRQGAIYDDKAPVRYKAKDVKLSCLLRARTLEEMWRNYYALCYDLARPGERKLRVQSLRKEYDCMYKSCSVSEFARGDGRIWLRFTLTLTFIGSYRECGL